MWLYACVAALYVVLAQSFEFNSLFSNNAGRALTHLVDLNVTIRADVLRDASGSGLTFLDVTVPFKEFSDSKVCASLYLIGVGRPLGAPETLTYFAQADTLGRALGPCAAINYTYDPISFKHPRQTYANVSSGWNVSFGERSARYRTSAPLALDLIVAECGGTYLETFETLGAPTALTRQYSFDVYACQVGYYGPNCDDMDGSYAAACHSSQVTVVESPTLISFATSVSALGRNFVGQLDFDTFDTSDAGGCFYGAARGVVYFSMAVSDFDSLKTVTYTNPPYNVTYGPGFPDAGANLSSIGTRQGVYVFKNTQAPRKENFVLWTIAIVTPLLTYTSNDTFAAFFESITFPGGSAAQFMFMMDFKNGNRLHLMSVIPGIELIDGTPSNGTCVRSPPPSPPPLPPPPSSPAVLVPLSELHFFPTQTVTGLAVGEYAELSIELVEGSTRAESRSSLATPVYKIPGEWTRLFVNNMPSAYPVNLTNGDTFNVALVAADTTYTRRAVIVYFNNLILLFEVITPGPARALSVPYVVSVTLAALFMGLSVQLTFFPQQ
jgi:hypothetical protein